MTKPNTKNKPILLLSLFIIGWVILLLIESSQPQAEILKAVMGLDKVAHFIAFCGLGLLACALSFNLNPRPAMPLFSMPLAIVIVSGIIEESYQMFIPGRTASLLDLLADICGAVFAILIANRVVCYLHVKNQASYGLAVAKPRHHS